MLSENEPESSAIVVRFASNVFSIDTVKSAAYRFTKLCSFDFKIDGTEIICELLPKLPMAKNAQSTLISAFRDEVLDQDLRHSIRTETADVRNAILAHAFSRSGLQDGD